MLDKVPKLFKFLTLGKHRVTSAIPNIHRHVKISDYFPLLQIIFYDHDEYGSEGQTIKNHQSAAL